MYCVVEVRRRRRRWRRRLGLGPQVLGLLPPHDLVASWCQLPQPRGPRPQVLAHRNASTLLPSTPACPPPLPSRILSCPLRHRLLTAPPWPAGAWSAPAAGSCCLLVPPLFSPAAPVPKYSHIATLQPFSLPLLRARPRFPPASFLARFVTVC